MMSSAPLLQKGVGPGPSVFAGVVWLNQIDVTDAQCLREFQKRHDRWIPLATLQATKVLLAEPRTFLDLLLGQASALTDAGKVSAHQLAHVHARSDGCL